VLVPADAFETDASDAMGTSGSVGSSVEAAVETSVLLGRPYALAIAAGSDGTSAARQLERICRGWRLRPVAETLVHQNGLPQTRDVILQPKVCTPNAQVRCSELGGLVAATVLLESET
jgi:hypothetical protein